MQMNATQQRQLPSLGQAAKMTELKEDSLPRAHGTQAVSLIQQAHQAMQVCISDSEGT